MWAEALDRMMGIIATGSGIDLSRIRAISGSGQQHGSVYLNASAGGVLAALDPQQPLAEQISGIFSRPDSPIWMDSSTASQCAEITAAVGGTQALARADGLAGVRALHRAADPQVLRDRPGRLRPNGAHPPGQLVHGVAARRRGRAHRPRRRRRHEPDGPRGRRWAPPALDATAPGLEARLPALGPSWAVVGRLSPYWTGRYGFPAARVIAWSGDNPCSLVGTGLVSQGRIAISLGTSDTLFGFMREPRSIPRAPATCSARRRATT